MSLTGQFMANTRLMAKMLVLDGKECPNIESKSTRQKQVCDLLWAPSPSIHDATLQEAAGCLNDADAQAGMSQDTGFHWILLFERCLSGGFVHRGSQHATHFPSGHIHT